MENENKNKSDNKRKELAPFSCSFTPQVPELLRKLNMTLAISTFQAGKILFISPKDDHFLVQLPRNFQRPMGFTISGDKMAVGTATEVIVLKKSKDLAASYPLKPGVYDEIWMPRSTFYTGFMDAHDLHFGNNGKLWAVNTLFSCLCSISDEYSFQPEWKPHFISTLDPIDKCHLNGLAMENGEPKYISALGKGDERHAWRKDITKAGILMDIESNEIVAEGLAMPHTPRIYDGKLYCLLSAAQKLISIDPENGHVEDVVNLPGFVRGMCRTGDYVFVATSKLRKSSSTFRHLDIPESANKAMIYIIYLPTGTVVGKLTYEMSVDEIYDIQVLENTTRPNIINPYKEIHKRALHLPVQSFWGKEKKDESQAS